MKTTILFGTETGNAEMVAEDLGEAIELLLHRCPPLGDPRLGCSQARLVEGAGPHTPDLAAGDE